MIYISSFTDRCILLLILAFLCVLSWWIYAPLWKQTGALEVLAIAENGSLLGKWSLQQETLSPISIQGLHGNMLLSIADGYVRVLSSSCAQQRCVLSGKIHRIGQSIVCVPNRIIITISSVNIVDTDANSEDNDTWDALSE
ncbi:MAG: NusG domain II-containing protein [Mariprofundales bacterium]